MTRRQFQELQKQRDFIMATNLSLTEVYIGAMSQEEVELAISKLDTLSKLKVSVLHTGCDQSGFTDKTFRSSALANQSIFSGLKLTRRDLTLP
jgi:hypothetical protein